VTDTSPTATDAPVTQPTDDATWSYDDFARRAEVLLQPLARLMEPGRSTITIEGPPSDHGEPADRFEAYARPCLLAALWLRSTRHTAPASLDPETIAAWFREGLVLGTDPDSDEFWGVLPSFHQFAVEMAILVMALDIGRETLWDPLTDPQRDQVARWLGQIRGHAGHHNNHLFFDVLVLEFLRTVGYGHEDDEGCADWLLDELESMHRRDGWFIDGGNESYDHYNAYAFHVYGLYWAWRHGDRDAERAERWKTWAASFIQDYARFFAASGEPVPFGRSLTYRFNGVGVFALAALAGVDTLDPGLMRRVCRKCIDYFMSRPIEQSQGCLSLGWSDRFEGIAEPYSCAGSPYWAAKGLMMLLLNPRHPFFTAPERPMPSETNEEPRVIRAPGFVVRSVGGEVELLNAGGWSSMSAATRFGQAKWGRLSYRSGAGFLVSADTLRSPPDAGLTAARPGETDPPDWFGRLKTIPLIVEPDHIRTAYTLSAPRSGFNLSVVTDVWLRGGWQFRAHKTTCAQPTVLRAGGYAVGAESAERIRTESGAGWCVCETDGFRSAIRTVSGWGSSVIDRGGNLAERRHLYAPCHAVPVLLTDPVEGDHVLEELVWCGPGRDYPPIDSEPEWVDSIRART
jgi:hypothetical protein